MYLDFYSLTDKPFSITPNPRYLFLSKHHREVFAHLLFGIRRHAGFIEVTGEVGTGKTTVLRTLFLELKEDEARIAYIFNPCLNAVDLLRTVNREFGLDAQSELPELHAALNSFLLQENHAGRTVVLVIDEAQNLPIEILEQIRLLSNLETETDKLIQIVLVGQPELGEILSRPQLRQLSQRITVRYHLQAMDAEDTAAYIDHRMGIAGWNRPSLFTKEALRKIYQITSGNPRMINVLCDRALVIGYAENLQQIDQNVIKKAGEEIRRQRPSSWVVTPSWRWALLLIPLLMAGIWSLPRQGTTTAAKAVTEAPAPIDLVRSNILPSLDRSSLAENSTTAINASLKLWRGTTPLPPVSGMNEALDATRDQGFSVARLQGDLDNLIRLQLPLLLEINRPSGPRFLLLLGKGGKGLRVSAADGRIESIRPEQLTPYWSGSAYLLWKNALSLPIRKGPMQTSQELVALQTLLSGAGRRVSLSGRYDEETATAIKNFQSEQGLPVDGIAGLQTLIALYRENRQFGFPLQPAGEGE